MSEPFEIAAEILPSQRQLEWQKIEFYAFCHFGMNTFTNKEWGDGTASPSSFNPTDFDAEQWANAIKNGGMKAIILTCKHHDGFCLWPSEYTDYSVKNSPFKDGNGDVVKEVSQACQKYGLKFGVYLSPWDRHDESYGQGEAYNTYYKNQLRELLSNYGDIFCVWLDGACGEGKNGKVQSYDWKGIYSIVRELQPQAVINVCGPDVRWIGNEAGVCRKSEWSVVPSWLSINEYTAEKSQKADDKKFAKKHNEMTLDLGSRKAIKNETDFIWYPSEVDVSIRPGWFYHKNEDYNLKSLKKLMRIYLTSVGGNSSLLLNIPPDTTGKINKTDELLLDSFNQMLKRKFPENIAKDKYIKASSELDNNHESKNILFEDDSLFWQCAKDDYAPEVVIDLGTEHLFDSVVLQENIATGQQIEEFSIYIEKNNRWKKIYKGTIIGYKKIACLKKKYKSKRIKICFNEYRKKCTLLKVEVYNSI